MVLVGSALQKMVHWPILLWASWLNHVEPNWTKLNRAKLYSKTSRNHIWDRVINPLFVECCFKIRDNRGRCGCCCWNRFVQARLETQKAKDTASRPAAKAKEDQLETFWIGRRLRIKSKKWNDMGNANIFGLLDVLCNISFIMTHSLSETHPSGERRKNIKNMFMNLMSFTCLRRKVGGVTNPKLNRG